jgi:dTDP-4-amino-4,6-dideoxy-D-glucose ammonia-lyase
LSVAKLPLPLEQISFLRSLLLQEAEAVLPGDALDLLRGHWTPALAREGLIDSSSGPDERDRWIQLAFQVVRTLAGHPFETQAEFARDLALSPDALTRLNRVLRGSDLAQLLIVEHGQAAKYWENTIIPLAQSGALDAARRNEVRHPFRVGLYAGVSCMFYCSFCGRNHDARYAAEHAGTGNALFDAMLHAAPTGDPYVFYLSGGLEPLTNPGLGEVVRAGAARGFKFSLYTNGFMLTPHLLGKQPGLWDLDTLRISLYGGDQASTYRVTRHEKAYEHVRRNAKTYLRMRNERGARTKFGFNFVLLRGQTEQVLNVIELIAEVNREAGGDRQVDFLTLREDYSVPPDRGLSAGEREQMVAMFAELEERQRRDDLCDLQIDFGYALHAESEGIVGRPLEMVPEADMRPHGYPQISVVVDLVGDVYLYREAGFLERPGVRRYVIGRVTPTRSLEDVVREFLESGRRIEPAPGDTGFFDIFDHVVTKLLNQADADDGFGVAFEQGPVRDRIYQGHPGEGVTVGHPTLAHPTLAHPTSAHPTLAHPTLATPR